MADVTISQLTQGTPNGNHLLPYSTGSDTLATSVSSIFQKTPKVYFNSLNDNVLSFPNNSITGTTSASFIIADNANKAYNGSADLNNIKNPPLLELRGTGFNFSEPKINFTEKGNVLGSIIVKNYAGNTGTFHFCTNNTNFAANSAVPRMTISSSGVVTKPFQPAFAVKAETQTLSFNNTTAPDQVYPKISFPRVILNTGNYYNAANSEFTAPVAGVYSFSGMLRLNTLPTYWMYPMVMINGEDYYYTTKSGDSQGALPGLMHISSSSGWTAVATNWHQLIALNVGDKITLGFGASDNKNYIIDNQSIFYGYLLG